MDPRQEELSALQRRREQNRIAQRRHRDNLRKRLKELGLDGGMPPDTQIEPTSQRPLRDSPPKHNYTHRPSILPGPLGFDRTDSETESPPQDVSLDHLILPDSQYSNSDGSVASTYAPLSSPSPASVVFPLCSTSSGQGLSCLEPTDDPSLHPLFDIFSPTVRFDSSWQMANASGFPIPPVNDTVQLPDIHSNTAPNFLGCQLYTAHTPIFSMVNAQTIPQAAPALSESPIELHSISCPPLPSSSSLPPSPTQTNSLPWTTPLHMSISRGSFSMMRLLLDKGADVNAVNSEGATPLHLGVKSGHGTMVAELLQRGADPARTDAAGWLPLHYAVNAGDEECLRILLEAEKQLDSHVQRLTRSGSCPGAAPGL